MKDIESFIYDPKTGLSSVGKLYKKLIKEGCGITQNELKELLDKQYIYQVNKQDNKPKQFNTIYAKDIGDNYQMDLLIYDRFEHHKYKYIFNVIDEQRN